MQSFEESVERLFDAPFSHATELSRLVRNGTARLATSSDSALIPLRQLQGIYARRARTTPARSAPHQAALDAFVAELNHSDAVDVRLLVFGCGAALSFAVVVAPEAGNVVGCLRVEAMQKEPNPTEA